MKLVRYVIQALVIYFFIIVIKILGKNLSILLISFIFKKFGTFFRSKEIIDNNLNIISKDFSKKEKNIIRSNMWINYASTFVEYFFLKKFRLNDDHIKIRGNEYLKKIIEKKEKAVFISGHFSNFELMSMELTKKGIELATIYRPLNNYLINPIMENIRRGYVCKNQIKKGLAGVKETIKYLNDGKSVALMVDQRVSEGERIPFFEKPALTSTLPAQLALKFKCNIIPIYIFRKNKNYEMEIYPPIEIQKYNLSEDYEKNKLIISSKINSIIEEMVKRDPSQWILTHNRWK
tara:strand:- start:1111 stop:1983 length:873 start_codon:yes stop_codon:yes gene_type:complete